MIVFTISVMILLTPYSSSAQENANSAMLGDISQSDTLWNSQNNKYAFCSNFNYKSSCFVITNEDTIDVSKVIKGNHGKLGYKVYDETKTYPSKWLLDEKLTLQVEFTTYIWKKGKRFTAVEKLMIKSGKPLYR